MTSFGQINLHKIIDIQWNYERGIYRLVVITVATDGLALLGKINTHCDNQHNDIGERIFYHDMQISWPDSGSPPIRLSDS